MLKIAVEDLERSGIDAEDAQYAEMYSVKDASKVYPDFKPTPALVIPYVDPWTDDFIQFKRNGKKMPFVRVRYYTAPTKVQGFGKKKKELRYTQPSESGVHPYFPVVEGIDWQEVLMDPDVPIMVTEGEKKALAACLAGIPCVGLGGVYNFTQDDDLLPILDKISWKSRQVYICYDSDAVTNNKIQAAEGRLATELSMKRDASVYMVRLPDYPDGRKMGLDDYIVRYGDDKFFELVEQAPQIRKIDKEILRLNNNVAWIEKDGLVLDLGTDTWIKKDNFKSGSVYSARTIEVPDKKGKDTKVISVAGAWLTHPHARRYTDTIFRPGTTDKEIQLASGGIAYNRFRGLEGEEGDVEPFFDLYDWIMSRTDEFDHDLMWKLICWKVQNLERKPGLGIVMVGTQGGGKSLFNEIIAEMFDPYSKTVSGDAFGSEYNGWMETALWVSWNETEDVKLKTSMAKLKTYVTDKRQSLKEKYRVEREVDTHFITSFNSNERSTAVFPDDDRRMIVILCPDTHPDGDEFYGPVWLWKERNGAKKLLDYFQNYDLDGWEPPRHAPQTREKRMAYHASLTPIQKIGHAIKKASENLVALWIAEAMDWAASDEVGSNSYQIALANQITSTMVHIQVRPFYTPEELSMMFPSISTTMSMGRVKDATPANQLAQELLQMGVEYLKCRDNFDGFFWKGRVRQYLIISDVDEWREPITQEEFERAMKLFPKYKEYRAAKRRSKRK